MSKATLTSDLTTRAGYERLDYTEFLEMLGRIAGRFYTNDKQMQKTRFDEKVERLLENVLSAFGYTLTPIEVEVEYVSESEEEFDAMRFFDTKTTVR
jgi:hypothetical protein